MKMVKSLLLGSAAGLVAVAGAQAADLPVKAKPVQYVKICSLYGVGFYYIPGTDMCLKIGGWVRAEYALWRQRHHDLGPLQRQHATTARRATARSVRAATSQLMPAIRLNTARCAATSRWVSAPATSVSTRRRTSSARTAPSSSGRASRSVWRSRSMTSTAHRRRHTGASYPASDTGDPGWLAFGYTAQFGNGFSATHRGRTAPHNPDHQCNAGVAAAPRSVRWLRRMCCPLRRAL